MTKKVFLNSREELISMFLGLGVVIIAVLVIVNFVVRSKGNILLTGLSTTSEQTALTTPVSPNNLNQNLYEVKRGDSLWSIALSKYGNGDMWIKIASENKLGNASVIEIGQKLSLPILSKNEIKPVVKTEVESQYYTVVSNDSLWKIAAMKLNSGYKWTIIWNLNKNKIVNPNRLEKGMVLRLN